MRQSPARPGGRPLMCGKLSVNVGTVEQATFPLPVGTATFMLTDVEGSTRLWESDPEAEELETRDKAAAFLDAIRQPRPESVVAAGAEVRPVASTRVLLVDHQDSFVHTLANYLRQGGADVTTLVEWIRSGPIRL